MPLTEEILFFCLTKYNKKANQGRIPVSFEQNLSLTSETTVFLKQGILFKYNGGGRIVMTSTKEL